MLKVPAGRQRAGRMRPDGERVGVGGGRLARQLRGRTVAHAYGQRGGAWVENPRAPDRVARGGSFATDAGYLRAAYRDGDDVVEPGYRGYYLGARYCTSGPD